MQRDTAQRRAICRVFEAAKRPLTVSEARASARRHARTLGIATAYRHINELVKDGWLTMVQIPGEPPHYERANLPHHHHFHCQKCQHVFDLAACSGARWLHQMLPPGFTMQSHEIILSGRCSTCSAA
jgi:Fur family transcriptional regulator, ferric uptake regulator